MAKQIVVTIEGGIIQDINIPSELEVEVKVMDFDTDDIPEKQLSVNDDGDKYIESIWE